MSPMKVKRLTELPACKEKHSSRRPHFPAKKKLRNCYGTTPAAARYCAIRLVTLVASTDRKKRRVEAVRIYAPNGKEVLAKRDYLSPNGVACFSEAKFDIAATSLLSACPSIDAKFFSAFPEISRLELRRRVSTNSLVVPSS